MGHQGDILRGTFFAVAGFTAWAITDALAKVAGLTGLSSFVILFISAFSAGFCGFAGLLAAGKLHRLKPVRVKLQLLRGLLFVVLTFAAQLSFTNLPVTTVYIAIFSSPFLISLYGRFFLGESLNKEQVMAIVLGFVGVLVALSSSFHMPVADGENPVVGYMALPVFLFSFVGSMIMMRHLGDTETPESTTFIPYIVRAVVFFPALFIVDLSLMNWTAFWCSLFVGMLGSLGFWFMIKSFKLAPMAVTSTMHYTQLLSGAVLGYLIWDRVPDVQTWAGGAMIIIAGIMIAFFARKGGLRPLPVQEEI